MSGKLYKLAKTRPRNILYNPILRVDYDTASKLQEIRVRQALDFKKGVSAVLPEPIIYNFEINPPVYTSGRRERGKIPESDQNKLKQLGAQFRETWRGGQTTFHGPGQLVVYPIIDLIKFGISPRCYVDLLQNSIISTLGDFNISAKTTEDTGVWISDTQKIASIGIHVRRGITSHGLALNVSTDLNWFNHIVACGLPGKSTTSMKELGATDDINLVSQTLSSHIAQNLQANLIDNPETTFGER